MQKLVPLPEFMPDQSLNSSVLLQAENVIPAVDGYRAVGAIATVSDALPDVFMGGASAVASDGTAFMLVGTATTLEKGDNGGGWTSLLTGLSVTERWKFSTFKDSANDDYVIAVNGTGDSYAVDLAAGTAAVIAAMPGATDVCVVGDHVVIARPDGDIARVAWSAFADHTGWTLAVDQAGDQPMRTGGPVMGVVGGEYGIILQRNRIVRMTRTGDSLAPFQFDEISNNFGCADGATIAVSGRTIYFYSDRGFVALDDGQQLRRIGAEKVDRTFGDAISREDLNTIYTAVDPENSLVWWLIPGLPGQAWVYNFDLDRWATVKANALGLFPGFTTSVGLDDLDGLGYTDLDAMTISLDDSFWTGGSPRLYAVSVDQKVGNFTGSKMAVTLQLGNVQLAPGRKARVRKVRPVWDGTDGMTATVNAKQRLGDGDAVTSSSTLRASGAIPIRVAGKYLSATMEVEAGQTWGYIQALEFEFDAGGER